MRTCLRISLNDDGRVNKVTTIKAIRYIFNGLGLKESKDLYEEIDKSNGIYVDDTFKLLTETDTNIYEVYKKLKETTPQLFNFSYADRNDVYKSKITELIQVAVSENRIDMVSILSDFYMQHFGN